MQVKSESEVAQSCPTPSDPMDCSLPGSSVHGIFQARVFREMQIKINEIPFHTINNLGWLWVFFFFLRTKANVNEVEKLQPRNPISRYLP